MLAANAPWWAGEYGNLPHNPEDTRPAYVNYEPTGANAYNYAPARQTKTSQENDQRGGAGNWMYSHAPAPTKSSFAPDLSAYDPGKAQPTQTQSTGTPYAANAYSPQPSSFYQQPSATVQNPGYGVSASGQPFANPMNIGNYANNAFNQRPQPFTMTATGIGGQQFDSMNQAMNQRAAALAQILDQGKLYKLAGATNQNIGPPQYNMNDIIGNANSMVNAGWQNPLGGIAGFGQPYQQTVPQPRLSDPYSTVGYATGRVSDTPQAQGTWEKRPDGKLEELVPGKYYGPWLATGGISMSANQNTPPNFATVAPQPRYDTATEQRPGDRMPVMGYPTPSKKYTFGSAMNRSSVGTKAQPMQPASTGTPYSARGSYAPRPVSQPGSGRSTNYAAYSKAR